jgi:Iron-dependent Transcriptional regulator
MHPWIGADAELAERTGIARRTLEPLPQALSRERLLDSTRGPHGGYRLGRRARLIKVSEAITVGLNSLEEGVHGKRCSTTLGRSVSGWVVGLPIPWHQLVDAFLRPAVDEACQQIRKIGLRIDLIQFAGLNQ